MTNKFMPLLSTTDWNEEWKALQIARNHPDNAEEWNERSKTFPDAHGSHSPYSASFLELAHVEPGESVLDMGCGTGALAIPLAAQGHRVVACDFSTGMLNVLRATAEEDGLDNVETHLMSWADNWDACGVGEKCVDVALASRSIATDDLQASLMKLHRAARHRVCITLPCGGSPRVDEALLCDLGLQRLAGRDFLYAVNILIANDIKPEIAYIPSRRKETFTSPEDAVEKLEKIVRTATQTVDPTEVDRAVAKLPAWVDEHIMEDDGIYRFREQRKITWAFISWNK